MKASIVSEKVTRLILLPVLELHMVRVLVVSITARRSWVVSWGRGDRPINKRGKCLIELDARLPDGSTHVCIDPLHVDEGLCP